jgi:HAE1 family hydrophobic/amphiphilic exporter-1
MLIGTLFGVLVIPGLYYTFAKMTDGKQMIKDESFEPISEAISHGRREDADVLTKNLRKVNIMMKLLRRRMKK